MRFIGKHTDFPVSDAVVFCGHLFQCELSAPGAEGAAGQMLEIFRQLDRALAEAGAAGADIVSVKLFLQDLARDLEAVDAVYAEYFGSHAPSRGVYGVDLKPGLLVEAAFVANVPVYE